MPSTQYKTTILQFELSKDMPGVKLLLYTILTFVLTTSYVQFQIFRNPHYTKKLPLSRSQCQDPATVSQQAKYEEICYEKDIAYVFQFNHLKNIKYLALDLTSPISWIKGEKCKMLDNNKSCTLLKQNIDQKIKGVFKQKINDIMKRLKKEIKDDETKAIIQGSNQVVMGEVDQVKNLSIVGKNQDHFDKVIDVFLLGLYIIGENDSVSLNTTTFINARKITPNLNAICDGAISLRFDQNSQKSFLNQVFQYMKTVPKNKIISIYLGKDKNIVTIGGMAPKYSENGLSSFSRVKLQESQFGKLPHMQGLILENNDDQTTIDGDSQIVFTLSASYISFRKEIMEKMLKQFFPSTLKCKINNESFVQCQNNDKEDVEMIKSASLDIDLDTSMIHFSMKDLVIRDEKNRLIFNIKQSQCDNSILGEPFFNKYYAYFDYNKNQIGYAPRKLTIQQSFISALTLIHFVILTLLLGCCFLATSNPCKKLYYHAFQKIVEKTQESVKKTLKAYQPVVEEQDDKDSHQNKIPKLEDVEGI